MPLLTTLRLDSNPFPPSSIADFFSVTLTVRNLCFVCTNSTPLAPQMIGSRWPALGSLRCANVSLFGPYDLDATDFPTLWCPIGCQALQLTLFDRQFDVSNNALESHYGDWYVSSVVLCL